SMDVVHVKWSACPTGDLNRAMGKEGHPTIAFQCITDFNRRILGIINVGRDLREMFGFWLLVFAVYI
ncbi:MAG: hypothetical protein ACK52F_00165, partial [bacterium]